MRYIVLSFDDGCKDFVENVEPILNKYNIKVSINVISSYSEKTCVDGFNYISNSEISRLFLSGHEISVHSDKHNRTVDLNDFNICRDKIKKIIPETQFGAILPFSEKIDCQKLKVFKENNYIYLADYEKFIKRSAYVKFLYFLNRFQNKDKRNKKISFLFNHYIYQYDISKPFFEFKRIIVRKEFKPKYFIYLIKHMKNNHALTFAFHSIVSSKDEKVLWPDGAWNTSDFEELISYIAAHNKKYKIVRQRDLL